MSEAAPDAVDRVGGLVVLDEDVPQPVTFSHRDEPWEVDDAVTDIDHLTGGGSVLHVDARNPTRGAFQA